MKQLRYEQSSPTLSYIDNMPGLQVIDENTTPKENCYYDDVLNWALQN